MSIEHSERQAARSPLIGRDHELAELDVALAEARAGRGRLFLVAGEPGIGKTRLAEAVSERAEATGMAAAWGRCWDTGGTPAFWPWVQLVRTLLREPEVGQLRAALGAGAGWVAQIVPDVRERLPDVEPPRSIEGARSRFSLFDAVACFLRNVSTGHPLLIVVDDFHAADSSSVSLLEFVARGVHDWPTLILVTYQEAAARQRSDVEKAIGALGRDSRRVMLRGFGEQELARMVEHRTGASPSSELVSLLHTTTEGNPFFTDEVVRLLDAEGQLAPAATGTGSAQVPLPDTVRETIRRRFEPLGARGIEVLQTAAVIGREFHVATLGLVSGAERGELIELLDGAVSAGLVAEVPGAIGRFRFTHGLIRETLYTGLATSERVRLHRAAGEALEQRYGDAPEHLSELAHHFAEAARGGGDPEAGLQHAKRAGHQAMEVLAYGHAAEMFELALDLAGLMDPSVEREAELMLCLGQARARAGQAEGRETLIVAAKRSRAVGRADLLARAALGIHAFALGTGHTDEVLVALIEEALDGVESEDSALRARLLARLAVSLYYTPGTQERRDRLVDEAIATARRVGDAATLAYVLSNAQLATWSPVTTERDLSWTEELLRLADEVGDEEIALATRNRQIDYLIELDDLAGADLAIDALERMAGECPDPRARAYVPLQRARKALIDGRLADANRLHAEATAVAARQGDTTIRIVAEAQLFGIRWAEGRLGEIEETARRMAGMEGTPAWTSGLALAHLELGREAEARSAFERLAVHDFDDIKPYNGWLTVMALLTELCCRLGDAGRAGKLYDLLAPYAERNVISPHALFAGPVARHLGMLATTTRDWDSAAAHFEAAEAAVGRANSRGMMAFVRLDEARMLAARDQPGDRDRALELLSDASEIGSALGLEQLVDRGGELRAALGEPEPRPAKVAPGATPREDVTASLRREGDTWAFDYGERAVRVRDSKGVRHLAALLSQPGVEIHSLDLAGGDGEGRALAPGSGEDSGLDVLGGARDAGPMLDSQAKAAYRGRLEELRDDLEEAESFNDPERASRAREEIQFLSQELASAVGLGGRDRKAASETERARVSVTKAIRGTLRRIAEHDAALGRELDATVRTGTFCVYEPDPRRPIDWRVEPR